MSKGRKFIVMLYNPRNETRAIIGRDYTKEDADREVAALRAKKLPAVSISHMEHRELFGRLPTQVEIDA